MAYTTVTSASVGQRIKASWLNLLVTAIQELQAALPGFATARPQLRVYAPASVTSGSKIPYASVRKDNYSGWNSTNKDYTIPVGYGGLWLVQIGYKCGASASTPSQYFDVGGTMQAGGPNSPSGSYLGGSLSFIADLAAGDVCSVKEQGASYTPQNDSAGAKGVGSNFLCMTYLGSTT